ncbi:MAG: hypothetical protein COZ25_04100 [Ignavibacteria bacterium CG_4_10_14_3_um_filter_37_18]|nr:MAG: hypothetical protein COZ25_04100 [Ignavibacteria bacterium CG_4_10_14_3_um_filter_37_18]
MVFPSSDPSFNIGVVYVGSFILYSFLFNKIKLNQVVKKFGLRDDENLRPWDFEMIRIREQQIYS